MVYMDYPEYCWINGASHVTGYGEPKNYCEVVPEYTISAEEITGRQTQIKGAGNDFLSDIDRSMDDYGKIKAVFEKCIRQIDYVKDAPENQTLYSGLVNGQTVCAGYARTFQYLMNRLDIPVIYVTGTTDTGEAHGWNIVKCGDNYYNVDVTWGDPVFAEGESGEYNLPDDLIYYDFLCVSDAEFRTRIRRMRICRSRRAMQMTSSITARSAGTWIHLMRRRFCGKWRRILKRQKSIPNLNLPPMI